MTTAELRTQVLDGYAVVMLRGKLDTTHTRATAILLTWPQN